MNDANFTQDELDYFKERAAIYEADGGMSRSDAEDKALDDIQKLRNKKLNGPRFVKIGSLPILPGSWIIRSLLEIAAFAMIFGDSGTLKTFLVICLSCCIATGKDFFGLKVSKTGPVCYVAAEGRSGLVKRFRAWGIANNIDISNAPLYLYEGVINLSMAADLVGKALDELIKSGSPIPIMIVFDTWSRSLGADDSDTAAAADGLAKIDQIRARYPGLAVLIVHHTGHANKERARGASLLHAAVDSEFRVERGDEGTIILHHTKSKESALVPPIAFRSKPIMLTDQSGAFISNDSGDIESSVVLEQIAYEAPVGSAGLGKNQERVLEVLRTCEGRKLPADELIETLKARYGIRKDSVDKAVLSLTERELLFFEKGSICLE